MHLAIRCNTQKWERTHAPRRNYPKKCNWAEIAEICKTIRNGFVGSIETIEDNGRYHRPSTNESCGCVINLSSISEGALQIERMVNG